MGRHAAGCLPGLLIIVTLAVATAQTTKHHTEPSSSARSHNSTRSHGITSDHYTTALARDSAGSYDPGTADGDGASQTQKPAYAGKPPTLGQRPPSKGFAGNSTAAGALSPPGRPKPAPAAAVKPKLTGKPKPAGNVTSNKASRCTRLDGKCNAPLPCRQRCA
jgi:hypothetical protein